jgi:hypothetical protein
VNFLGPPINCAGLKGKLKEDPKLFLTGPNEEMSILQGKNDNR